MPLAVLREWRTYRRSALLLAQRITFLDEVPAAGSFYWYLVRGNNEHGEGPSGFERFRGLILARVEDSSGMCP